LEEEVEEEEKSPPPGAKGTYKRKSLIIEIEDHPEDDQTEEAVEGTDSVDALEPPPQPVGQKA
jgi:hypothetical protein